MHIGDYCILRAKAFDGDHDLHFENVLYIFVDIPGVWMGSNEKMYYPVALIRLFKEFLEIISFSIEDVYGP